MRLFLCKCTTASDFLFANGTCLQMAAIYCTHKMRADILKRNTQKQNNNLWGIARFGIFRSWSNNNNALLLKFPLGASNLLWRSHVLQCHTRIAKYKIGNMLSMQVFMFYSGKFVVRVRRDRLHVMVKSVACQPCPPHPAKTTQFSSSSSSLSLYASLCKYRGGRK